MAKVTIEGSTLTVNVEGLDQLWSFKSRFDIPLGDVMGATAGVSSTIWEGWRSPGVHIPGVLAAGTFHKDGERVFWDVHDPTKAVVIELDHEHYKRLLVGVEDPAAAVALIEGALRLT